MDEHRIQNTIYDWSTEYSCSEVNRDCIMSVKRTLSEGKRGKSRITEQNKSDTIISDVMK
jgi:hypothetical protein